MEEEDARRLRSNAFSRKSTDDENSNSNDGRHEESSVKVSMYLHQSTELLLFIKCRGNSKIIYSCRRNEHIHIIKHMAGPGIDPRTPAILVRSFTTELPGPISTVYIICIQCPNQFICIDVLSIIHMHISKYILFILTALVLLYQRLIN